MKNYSSPDSQAKAEAAWSAAQRLLKFGYADISFEVSVSVAHATHIVQSWERDGKVRRIAAADRGRSAKLRFEIVPEAERHAGPVQGDAFDQMWFAMRRLGSFSPTDLAAHCAIPVAVEDAAAYCRTLLAGSYLRVVSKAVPRRKEAVYRLFNSTGVRAPRERRVRCILDPNTGKVVPLVEGGL